MNIYPCDRFDAGTKPHLRTPEGDAAALVIGGLLPTTAQRISPVSERDVSLWATEDLVTTVGREVLLWLQSNPPTRPLRTPEWLEVVLFAPEDATMAFQVVALGQGPGGLWWCRMPLSWLTAGAEAGADVSHRKLVEAVKLADLVRMEGELEADSWCPTCGYEWADCPDPSEARR